MEFNEYIELWKTKNPNLMRICGMDKRQKESINDFFMWTVSILERIGNEIQEGMTLNRSEQYRLSIIMRSLYSYNIEKAETFVENVMRME